MDESEIRETIHDINNTLTVVLASAELILADAGHGSQTSQDAHNIRLAAIRGRELIATLREQLNLT